MVADINYQESLGRFRHLSGERLAVARRVFRQDIVIMLVLSAIAIPIGTVANSLISSTVYVVAGLYLILQTARVIRGETYVQLRLRESREANNKADEALKELNNFAEGLNENDTNDRQAS